MYLLLLFFFFFFFWRCRGGGLGGLGGLQAPACDMYRVAISPEMRSKSKMRPPTASFDGGESHRWRKAAERPRDAAVCRSSRAFFLSIFARKSLAAAPSDSSFDFNSKMDWGGR